MGLMNDDPPVLHFPDIEPLALEECELQWLEDEYAVCWRGRRLTGEFLWYLNQNWAHESVVRAIYEIALRRAVMAGEPESYVLPITEGFEWRSVGLYNGLFEADEIKGPTHLHTWREAAKLIKVGPWAVAKEAHNGSS